MKKTNGFDWVYGVEVVFGEWVRSCIYCREGGGGGTCLWGGGVGDSDISRGGTAGGLRKWENAESSKSDPHKEMFGELTETETPKGQVLWAVDCRLFFFFLIL